MDYVVDEGEAVGDAVAFVLDTLTDPFHAAVFAATGVATVSLAAGYLRFRPFRADVAAFRESVADYRELVPWLLRISLGFPLIGAGFTGYFFSPAVPAEARLVQVALGFFLLFGLATRVAAIAGLGLYALGLATDPGVLLANEFVAGFLAIALVGPGHPSADDVLGDVASAEGTIYGRVDPVHEVADRARNRIVPYQTYAPTVVRVGLGLNFVYLGVTQKLVDPGRAMAVVAKYDLTAVLPVDPALWVVGAGLGEAALGVLLVVGLFSRAAALAALFVFTLTLFGLPDDPVLAHLALFGLASSVLISGSGPLGLDHRLAALTGAVSSEPDLTPT